MNIKLNGLYIHNFVFWLEKICTEEVSMKLDGFGLFVNDMPKMVRFYRDVLGFEITEGENAVNVYLIKNGTLFMLTLLKKWMRSMQRQLKKVLVLC